MMKSTIFYTQCLLAVLCFSRAQAANVVTMGYGEGSPGAHGIQVMVTATHDDAIHGYSLAFTYPSDALTLTAISTTGTSIQAVNPDFVAPSVDNQLGVGTMGVIFSFNEPISLKELPASVAGTYPIIIARLTFDVKVNAAGGVYTVALKDGIGKPANFNRFSSKGKSIVPRLESGTFVVAGGNSMSLDKKIAFAGATNNLAIFAYAQHPDPLAGFQIGLTFDKQALGLTSATYAGTSLGIELGSRDLIEAFQYDLDTNFSTTLARASVATLFDFAPPFQGQTLSPSTDSPASQSLIKFVFSVTDKADDNAQFQDLVLSNTNIPGAIDNRFIIEDRSVDPTLIGGKIYFSQGNLTGKVVDSVTKNPVPAATVTTEPDGYQTTTTQTGSFRLDGIPPGKYALRLSLDGYYMSRFTKNLDQGTDIVVNGLGADDSAGTLPMYLVPVGGGVVKPFLRAYVNGDGAVDIADAIYILLYLFRGGSAPSCLLAADVNDDNRVDISDSVFLLGYLFAGGEKPLPPFSQSNIGCANDPTPGDLDCEDFSCSG